MEGVGCVWDGFFKAQLAKLKEEKLSMEAEGAVRKVF